MMYQKIHLTLNFVFLITAYNLLECKPFPISFSIPESKIVINIPNKDKDFASIIPGNPSTYIYNNEQDYYKDYQRSFFAITRKKAGWDCLRHYEILANGCIPYFLDIDQCPANTMHLFPKELIKEAMNLPGVSYGKIDHKKFDETKYYEILNKLLNHTKKYLTSRSMAQYLLDTIGYSGKGKILYLSVETFPDYLIMFTLIGLKQIAPQNIIDFPKLDYIYTNYPLDPKNLNSKGFTYTKIITDVAVDRNNLETRIKNKEFEFIIYAKVHYGMPFYDIVTQNYPPEKIVYMDGQDEHHNCFFSNFTNLFLREYDAYSGN